MVVRNLQLAVTLLLLSDSMMLRAQARAPIDVAVTYVAQRSIQASNADGFWAYGGSLELGVVAYRGFGVAANVTGVHTDSVGSGHVPLSLVSFTFGPRYRWHAGHTVSPYGEALLGETNGFRSIFPGTQGASSSASSLAVQLGGGLDLRLSPRLAIRPIQASWLRTQLPNGANDRQNNLQLGSGIVAYFPVH